MHCHAMKFRFKLNKRKPGSQAIINIKKAEKKDNIMETTLEKKIYLKLKSHEICSTQNIQNTGQRERRPNVILTETQLNSTFKKSSLRNDLSIN